MEGVKPNDEDSIISTNNETSKSEPYSIRTTRSKRAIQKAQQYCDLNFVTNLMTTNYHNYYQVLAND